MGFLSSISSGGGGGGGGAETVDNFEDDPDGPYASGDDITTYYGGDVGVYSRQQGTVIEDSYSLEATGTTSSNIISSTNGLANYPAQGDTFEATIQFTNSNAGSHGLLFATQSESGKSNIEGYEVHAVPAGPRFQIRRWEGNGNANTLDDAQYSSFQTNTEYRFEVSWSTNGTIDATVFEAGSQVAAMSATDTNYTSGGIGWAHNEGDSSQSSFFDTFQIL